MKYLRRRRPTRNPFDIIREMEEAAEKNRSIKLQGDDLLQVTQHIAYLDGEVTRLRYSSYKK